MSFKKGMLLSICSDLDCFFFSAGFAFAGLHHWDASLDACLEMKIKGGEKRQCLKDLVHLREKN